MKTRSVLGIVVVCSFVGCGGEVPLNGGDGEGRGGQESLSDGGGISAAINIGPTEAGVVHEAAVVPASDAPSVGPTPTCGSSGTLGITINPSVYRFNTNGTTPVPYRPANEDPNGIDTQDCDDNIILQFQLEICGLPTTDTFQVWAGPTDCTQQSARVAGTSGPFCWRVALNPAVSQTTMANVYARDLTQFIGDASSDVLAYTPNSSVSPGVDACDAFHGLAKCGVGLSVYFMAIEGDNLTIDATATYSLNAVPDPTDIASCGACGLTLYSSDYASSCQSALDSTCCAQEQACGGSAACTAVINCINACPAPREDSCVNACVPASGVPSALTALANCSKTEPLPAGTSASTCDWPN